MQALWGERRRIGLWRRLWLALLEVQQELGLEIPERALAEVRAHLDDADLERAAEHEKRVRHDVVAHIHHLGEQAPAARAFIHLGATSAYVTDNADLILMREGLRGYGPDVSPQGRCPGARSPVGRCRVRRQVRHRPSLAAARGGNPRAVRE